MIEPQCTVTCIEIKLTLKSIRGLIVLFTISVYSIFPLYIPFAFNNRHMMRELHIYINICVHRKFRGYSAPCAKFNSLNLSAKFKSF